MGNYHRLLKRQIKQHLNGSSMESFLDSINEAYKQFDSDRSMLERSLELSSDELLLANSEMRAIIDSFPDLFFLIENDGTIVDCRSGSTNTLFLGELAFLGKRIQDVPHPSVAAAFSEAISRLQEGETQVSTEYSLSIHGQKMYFEARLTALHADQIFVIIRDITQKTKGQNRLTRSLSLYREILESTADGILVISNAGKIVSFNQRFIDMWRIPANLIKSQSDERLLQYVLDQLKDPDGFSARVAHLYQHPNDSSEDCIEFLDGRYFERHSQPYRVDGKVLGRVWCFHDASSARNSLKALEDSEAHVRLVLDRAMDAIIVLNARYEIVNWNPRATEIFGWPATDALGQTFSAICLSAVDAPLFDKSLAQHLVAIPLDSQTFELACVTMQRKGVVIEFQLTGAYLSGASFVIVFAKDVTEKRNAHHQSRILEARLAQSAKLESLGRLAGGVAHDLNNLLGPLVGYPDLIIDQLGLDHPAVEDLVAMRDSATRASMVIRDLLTLARRGNFKPKPLSLNQEIRNYTSSPAFKALCEDHRNVSLQLQLEEVPNISGSSAHLAQVIMNLVNNAFEATTSSGCVTVKTCSIEVTRPIVEFDPVTPGLYVALEIQDTGVGINTNNIAQLVEPFYSTKTMGKSGSGLGLSIVYGAVKDHGGHLQVEAAKPAGSIFRVYFPPILDLVDDQTGYDSPRGSGQSVLVIDDVESQRTLAVRFLNYLGYSATGVGSGPEAIEYIKTRNIDLILLDMILNNDEYNGLETYREISAIHPTKCLIMSGYSENDQVKNTLLSGADGFIHKPFTVQSLAESVNRILLDQNVKT